MIDKDTTKKLKNQEAFNFADKHLSVKSLERFKECGCWVEKFANREKTKSKVHQANY